MICCSNFSYRVYSKRIFFSNKEIYINWLNPAFQLVLWFLSTFHLNLISYKQECLSVFPFYLPHFIFLSFLKQWHCVLWVLMLIEAVPERMCTWHVKEWVINGRYKYFQCQGFVKTLLWKPAYWIPIIPFRFLFDRFPAPYLDSYMLIKKNVAYFDKVGKVTVFLNL